MTPLLKTGKRVDRRVVYELTGKRVNKEGEVVAADEESESVEEISKPYIRPVVVTVDDVDDVDNLWHQ